MLSVGSLFAGIGGFDYGLERAGMRVAWQCEADEFCRRALAYRWPDVPCYPDVRELRGADVESVDVLCGGFPCQDISTAGRGAGIDGERSGLWSEYARLIGELRPNYVVVENVAALLTRGLGRVLGDLAACGYDAEWDCLPASAFGAPHRRNRVWLIAYPDADAWGFQERGERDGDSAQPGLETSQRSDADGLRANVADAAGGIRRPLSGGVGSSQGARRREALADPIGTGLEGHGQRSLRARAVAGGGQGSGDVQDADECAVQPWRVGGRAAQAGGSEWWAVEPPVGRVAHGVPDRLAQLAALGNALVPQIAEWLGSQILDYERRAA